MMMGPHSGFYKSRVASGELSSGPDRDRWLLSYADLLTLLLAFFVVMFSMSEVDVTKLGLVSESFSGGVGSNEGGSGHQNMTSANNIVSGEQRMIKDKADSEMLTAILDADVATNSDEGEWLLITMDSSVLFRSGSAEVVAVNALRDIALTLSVYDGEIIVEGHTDDTPISTDRFPSNWELSAARAAAVVRLLENAGISSIRLNATGFSDTRPLVSNATPEGREKNRRVVFRLKRTSLNSAALAAANDAKNLDEVKRAPAEVDAPAAKDFQSEFDLDNVSPELLLQLLQQIERDEAKSSTQREEN
ncbi:MAG: chemotaxis protein MotB [Candidatus Azotimanducaceae bacterium]|jgi:chemotaxis protein MotB